MPHVCVTWYVEHVTVRHAMPSVPSEDDQWSRNKGYMFTLAAVLIKLIVTCDVLRL